MSTHGSSGEELARIIESARHLGVELDEAEALGWLTAMAASQSGSDISDIVVDIQSGVFGHKVSMLDFSTADLDYFRRIGQIVSIEDRPGVVESALALSGSAAQSKIQSYPGDCDFFERVNIMAPTREQACAILADLIREKALSSEKGANYRLTEVMFGSFPYDCERGGKKKRKGDPIAWLPQEVRAGQIEAAMPDGTLAQLNWEEVANESGWCKLDWIVADQVRGKLSNASNMLDVTWEAPGGSITPLDGYLDSYFQEVYLEAESIPIFSKLARQVSSDALDRYVEQLEKEVRKYVLKDINYGKAAKRMYNVFRLTGRYTEAAFIRELFDEPSTILYQVWALIRALDEACAEGSTIPLASVIQQADSLIVSVVGALEGAHETEVVKSLLRLRDSLSRQERGEAHRAEVEGAQAYVINVINNFFHERLNALPSVKEYMDGFSVRG
ncbi:MAG: hypothetical protein ABIO92_07540 [Chloroflexia bacterium]